jgi:hypothetical protein
VLGNFKTLVPSSLPWGSETFPRTFWLLPDILVSYQTLAEAIPRLIYSAGEKRGTLPLWTLILKHLAKFLGIRASLLSTFIRILMLEADCLQKGITNLI